MGLNGIIAFSVGLLSFFAPCVLPLVPSYLVFISGVSIDHYGTGNTNRFNKSMCIHALAFVLGFSFVFISLGVSSSMIGRFFSTYQIHITRIGGILLIIMGFFSLNLINLPFLERERIIRLKEKPLGIFGSFIVGITFSLGWTPCIGPALASILIIASTEESSLRGAYLLSMYSLGLSLPFIVSAFLFHHFFYFIKRYGFIVKYTKKITGILLIIVGFLLATSYFSRLTQWLEMPF